MFGRFLLVIAAATTSTLCCAQDIILSDSAPPKISSDIFSETCVDGRRYALELALNSEHLQVVARDGIKVAAIGSPNLLDQIHGYDLYSVRMHCSASGGLFIVNVRKEDGHLDEQVITVINGDVNVGPIRALKRLPRLN